jgi:hypothetical protein
LLPSTPRRQLGWTLLALLIACRPTVSDPGDTSGEGLDIDRYDPEHLTVVQGWLEDAEWQTLLHETRLFYELLLAPDCLLEPFPNVFEWHPGTVDIDGEAMEQVGFRKKGMIGSLSWTRPSFKLDSDRFVDGQHFADDSEHFTLNNNNQDPSRLHTCLGYAVFRAAGVPAPRCAFATVAVNDEPLGVYSNVQPIKDPFLMENFSGDEGDLYEGTASDFNDAYLATFEIKTDGSSLAPLEEVAEALRLDDDALMDRLAELIDVDAFVTFWAVEGLLGHWDGYTAACNNFCVYHDPGDGLLRFIPWGADALFEDPTSDPLHTGSQLARRLYNHPDAQAAWYAETQRLLDEVWDEAWLLWELDRMSALIEPHLLDPATTAAGQAQVRSFVEQRRAKVRTVLDATPPSRPLYEPERYCVEPIGQVTASFSLPWSDNLDHADYFAGEVSLSGEIYGEPLIDEVLAGVAGPSDGAVLVAVMGLNASYTEADQVILVLPDGLPAGGYDVDICAITGYIMRWTNDDESEITGLLGGEVSFDQLSCETGGTLSGELEAIIIPNIFG